MLECTQNKSRKYVFNKKLGVCVMLIEFEFENFLSYKDKTLFSLEKGARLTKYSNSHTIKKNGVELLKNVNIFGANASGKSNLITAIRTFVQIVNRPTKNVKDNLIYFPFALNRETPQKPTMFSMKFLKDDLVYKYRLVYNASEVFLEELYICGFLDEKLYFRRTNDIDEDIITLPENLSNIRQMVRSNKLLLFDAQDKNDPVCSSVFEWFHSNLIFEDYDENVFELLEKQPKLKELFINILNALDFPLIDIEVNINYLNIGDAMKKFLSIDRENLPVPYIPEKFKEVNVYSYYKSYDSEGNFVGMDKIPYSLESSGTRKIMLLLLVLLDNLEGDKVIIMDEFDDSFHLSLAKDILDLINSEQNSNQFIFTTHNLNLLDHHLRVDQIYLVEKDFMGKTELFSLFDFNDSRGITRSDITYFKRYLRGIFGALPDTDIENVKKMLGEYLDG